MLLEEIDETKKASGKSDKNGDICMEKVNATWSEDLSVDTLNNINITVPSKKLYAVVGPVGAGKVICLTLITSTLSLPHSKF